MKRGGIPFGKKKGRGPTGGQAKGPPLMPPGGSLPSPPGLMPPVGGAGPPPMAAGGPGAMMDPQKAAMLAKLLSGEG